MTTLYGIKNCDTVKKARKWLENHSHNYAFHDFRDDGLSAAQVKSWSDSLGTSTLINRRSTSWKQLSDTQKALFDESVLTKAAIKVVLEYPTLIKRPLLDKQGKFLLGFNEKQYRDFLSK